MGFPDTLSQTGGSSSPLKFGRHSAVLWGLQLAYHLGTTPSQMASLRGPNRSLERDFQCFLACHPTSWSPFLPWVEYAHNSLILTSTGMSPFMA